MTDRRRQRPAISAGTRLALWCTPAVIVQLGGLGIALRRGWDEVNLLAGLLLFVVGTAGSMAGLEGYLSHLWRDGRWAWLALLGPVAPFIVARLAPGSVAPARRPVRARSGADRVVGWALIAAVGAGSIWAAAQWLEGHRWPVAPTVAEVIDDEQRAYQRMGEIMAAQRRYRERDYDGDGQSTYALFHIHLWRSVDTQGNAVPVDLISRELGFAMAREFALDGYVFQSLHYRALPPGQAPPPRRGVPPGTRELDPAAEWGIVAKPAFPLRSGLLTFIADQTGQIWVSRAGGGEQAVYPHDPAARRWIAVTSRDELAKIQADISYAEKLTKARK